MVLQPLQTYALAWALAVTFQIRFATAFVSISQCQRTRCAFFKSTMHATFLRKKSRSKTETYMSSDENDGNDGLNNLQRMLESSWNAQTMGNVPTSPESAAKAAADCINNISSDSGTSITMVDINLPQYDPSQSGNMYDEILAVEFCVALVSELQRDQGSLILVKNNKILSSVTRVLKARNQYTDQPETVKDGATPDKDEGKGTTASIDESNIEFYDDFADFGSIGDSVETPREGTNIVQSDNIDNEVKDEPSSDDSSVDSFRQQLQASWTTESDIENDDKSTIQSESKATDDDVPQYRLSSMLGDDEKIAKGSDMEDDVIQAVSENALLQDNEDTLIVLSAASRAELVAVRTLVNAYKKSNKHIILVNCKFDPVPRELSQAVMAYSITPLVAKSNDKGTTNSEPKIVVLRRYPGNWQVYIDTKAEGFELAAEYLSNGNAQDDRRGPSMDWVVKAVKKYLQFGQLG